ncbi:MAG TPA: hypothetical protein DD400_03320 [Rhodospirillaceae bacterium]|nr:hypothetical protein [Rhodospirillaceae bacterium]
MSEDKAKKEKAVKKSNGGKIVLFMILFGGLVPFGIPTFLVCLGLVPTLIVLFTETDSRHPALATVGYMNLAGVLPFIIELWERGQTMEAALSIIRNPQSWVVMLGAAGIGQLILYVVPSMVASMIIVKQEARYRVLRDGVKQLEAIWGKDVANTMPLDIVRANQKG